jgi:hypothetical protein
LTASLDTKAVQVSVNSELNKVREDLLSRVLSAMKQTRGEFEVRIMESEVKLEEEISSVKVHVEALLVS